MTPKMTSWSPCPGLHTIPASGEKFAVCPQHVTKDEPTWVGRKEKLRWSHALSESLSQLPDSGRAQRWPELSMFFHITNLT